MQQRKIKQEKESICWGKWLMWLSSERTFQAEKKSRCQDPGVEACLTMKKSEEARVAART